MQIMAKTYRIGYYEAYPYHSRAADQRPEGFLFEALDEAANRQGIRLEWVAVNSEPKQAFAEHHLDLWPRMEAAVAEQGKFYVTAPWMSQSFSLLRPREPHSHWPAAQPPQTIALDGLMEHQRAAQRLFPQAERIVLKTPEAALSAVCSGKADAALFEQRIAMALLMERWRGCRGVDLVPVPVEGSHIPVGLGATPAAGPVAEALRRGLERLSEDGTLTRLQAKWFHTTPSEVQAIIDGIQARQTSRLLWGSVVALAAALVVALVQQRRASRARKAAEEANAAKTRFIAAISHEIRTPMNGFLGMTGVLADSPLNERQKEIVQTIQQSAGAILTVLNDILDLSKMENGKLSVQPVDTDLRNLLEGVVALLRGRAVEKAIHLELEWDPRTPRWVRTDPARLRQILTNLLSNAIKFTNKGGVVLRTAVEDLESRHCRLRLSVLDTGIGIKPEDAGRIFEPFTQLGSARGNEGTGLGLAITKNLVELLHGEIGFTSEPGKGSTFWVSLPVVIVSQRDLEKNRPAQLPLAAGRACRILVAEDNSVGSMVAAHMLEKMGHYVHVVSTGREACDVIDRRVFDLILMDVQLPEMNGLEATAQIRKQERGRRTPIIGLSAAAMPQDREQCLRAGMDDFLPKPIDPDRLAAMIQKWATASDPTDFPR